MTDDIRAKAGQAAELLTDGHIFSQVWQDIDRDILSQWRSAATAQKREELHMKQRLLEELKGEFRAAIENAVRTSAGNAQEVAGWCEFLKRILKG